MAASLRTMGCTILCLFRQVTKLCYRKMDWVRWASDSTILGARAHHKMEAEGEPQVALAPAAAPAPAIAPAPAFDTNASLRVPRTDKGRRVTRANRLLRPRGLNSEAHESAFQSPKSITLTKKQGRRYSFYSKPKTYAQEHILGHGRR